ncbi:MAG: 1,4-dihydroxy-2-naphthoate polyprenyltransferase [Buchananella hordeovulneris]|nr:1,4-dihydroxy-2-naphthoate polyprenyltransferase [Buchananella hordeovulneris]
MTKVEHWVEGARLRTLPLALAPTVLANGAAYFSTVHESYLRALSVHLTQGGEAKNASVAATIQLQAAGFYTPARFWLLAILTTLVALCLTVGVNFANDYSDGVRGTDDVRLGPPRLTGGGLARPEQVKAAAFLSFGIAAVSGLAVVALSGLWWLLAVGVAAVLAAWFYTGGKRPYGYAGLGELAVFVFYGLVAVLGTLYVQRMHVFVSDLWLAAPMGAYACAVLMVNNLRDIPTDSAAGKRTLAVRIGPRWARISFAALLAVAPVCAVMTAPPATAFPFGAALLAAGIAVAAPVLTGAKGKALITALKRTSLLTLAYSLVWVALWALAAL